MECLAILGWIVIVLVAVYGLGLVASRSPDGGVRWMMHVQGWALLLCAAAVGFVLPVSNFFVLLAIPISFYLPMGLMKRRADREMKHFLEYLLPESQASGRPIGDFLNEDLKRRGYKPEESELVAGTEIPGDQVPVIGQDILFGDVHKQVFRIVNFDREGTTVDSCGNVTRAGGRTEGAYGFLHVECPIAPERAFLPIVHRDDFLLATFVYDDPKADQLMASAELLVTYVPKRIGRKEAVAAGGRHCFHYALCSPGTLEEYYEVGGGIHRSSPAPEKIFGCFTFEGEICVRTFGGNLSG